MIKILQLIWGPLAAGAPSHGTTGTMVNPALPRIMGFLFGSGIRWCRQETDLVILQNNS